MATARYEQRVHTIGVVALLRDFGGPFVVDLVSTAKLIELIAITFWCRRLQRLYLIDVFANKRVGRRARIGVDRRRARTVLGQTRLGDAQKSTRDQKKGKCESMAAHSARPPGDPADA